MKKIILLLTLLLSGCARIKIQDYLYPISIGLDYINNEYIIYYQIVSYSKISKIENESSIDSNYETVVTEVTEDLTPILEIYNIEKEDFHQCLLDVVGNLQDDGASFLTSEHIIKVIFSILHKNRGIRTYRFH